MAKVMITESYLEDIADAIREKKGGSNTYTPGEMAAAISSIDSGGGDDFVIRFSWDSVNQIWTPDKTLTEVQNALIDEKGIVGTAYTSGGGAQSELILEDENPLTLIVRLVFFNYTICQNGNIFDEYVWDSNGFNLDNRLMPIISPNFETITKTYTPTESIQTEAVTFDSNDYNGLQEVDVTVNAIPSNYVGSGITRQSSSDLTVSGATVTVPAGYYENQASKSVSTMTLPTSAASSATSGYTSKATIGRSTSAQYINIPPGYNGAGAYYVISAVANGSASAPSTISGTSATVSTGANTLTLTKTVSVTPTVSAGYVSSGTATNSSVSLTASVTTKAAATITPGTTDQTIASGTYLTGTQTIVGDSDLVGSNILSTANIFGVQGAVVVQKYYTGSSAPSSSLGSNGDLYLQS